ncbi:MAG: hypothetical protein JXA06_07535 [Bacteroidetes bacterium]|nr:hypothetical protein [Bacteroidota bacterium]
MNNSVLYKAGDGDVNLRPVFKEVNIKTNNNEEKTKAWKAANIVIQALSSRQEKKINAKEEDRKDSAGNLSAFIIIY